MSLIGIISFIFIIINCLLCAISLDRYIKNKYVLSLFSAIFMFVMALYCVALLVAEVLK